MQEGRVKRVFALFNLDKVQIDKSARFQLLDFLFLLLLCETVVQLDQLGSLLDVW